MTPNRRQNPHQCRVVGGPAEVASLRANDPTAAVLALVDESSPTDAILAQLAGADVVLTVPAAASGRGSDAGLKLAIRAAEILARRRNTLADASRDASHDVAEILNVLGLVADAGRNGLIDATSALGQIRELIHRSGDEVWQAGRAHRSSTYTISCLGLHQLFDDLALPNDVHVTLTETDPLVFVDGQWFAKAIGELVASARQAGATNVAIEVSTASDAEYVEILISDDGTGRPNQVASLGLERLAEHAIELGGSLTLSDPGGGSGASTQVALSLPLVNPALISSVETVGPDLSPADPAAPQANILEGVVRHAPLDESLEEIVAAIEHRLPGTLCSVLLLEHDRLRHGAGARLPLAYREAIDGVEIGAGQGSCGTAAFTGHPVVASDVTTDSNWIDFRSIATAHGLRSCWSTPILAAEDGEILGTFAVYTASVWEPDEAAVRLVNRFTYLAAVAIEHHRLFGALAESEARFRGAFEGAAAGIALVTLEGIVLKSNPALTGILGDDATDIAGTSLLRFVEAADAQTITESWRGLVTDSAAQSDPVEVPLVPTPGTVRKWLSLHTSLIPGESDRQPYLYVEVRDVTAARRQRADLRAREAAEASNRAKSDFLALASHELRTPLNAILGFAQVMQLVELDDDQRNDGVDQIVNAGRHLRNLIDQLLDLSAIESGQLAAETGPVDTATAIGEALEMVGPVAAARDIELLGDHDGVRWPAVRGDHRCLRQVLINLLDNAVKYTEPGGRVEVAVEQRSNAMIRITVADSGSGISENAFDAIFQPFYRLEGAAEGESEGTGLGLSLCERLMREMDGTIGVASTVGVGSTFWVELPTATTPLDSVATGRHGPTGTSFEPSSSFAPSLSAAHSVDVLYIEDDPACVEVMKAALRLRPDITLTAAGSAEEGTAALDAAPPDLVLLDVGLPDRSGWDLLVEIREERPTLPVVVLTAGAAAAPPGGPEPDQVFTKPVDITDVLRAVDVACSGATSRNPLPQPVNSRHQ